MRKDVLFNGASPMKLNQGTSARKQQFKKVSTFLSLTLFKFIYSFTNLHLLFAYFPICKSAYFPIYSFVFFTSIISINFMPSNPFTPPSVPFPLPLIKISGITFILPFPISSVILYLVKLSPPIAFTCSS
jgi:hypothetical protein